MIRTPRRPDRSHSALTIAFVRAGMIVSAGIMAAAPVQVVSAAGDAMPVEDMPVDTGTSQQIPDSTVNDFLDLERSLTECISSNPPPGCGRVPTGPGDRGGWQQLVLFGVMMCGIAVVFWRVSRAVRKRDATASAD